MKPETPNEETDAPLIRCHTTPCEIYGCEITGAIRISRATWVCPRCGADVSLSVVLFEEARQIKNP